MTIAVLTSGGLDSYVAWAIAPDPKIAIWVNFGQPYMAKEASALINLGVPYKEVFVQGMFPNPITIDNWIIPGRNLLLAFAGAQYGEEVWLSALDGEMHKQAAEKDKSPEFFHLSSGLFTYIFNIIRPETRIVTPFKTSTKAEVVALALSRGVSKDDLRKTSTCYHEHFKNCGLCGTCFKRWIAMTLNDVEENYVNPPWEAPYAIESRMAMRKAIRDNNFYHYSRKRVDETKRALLKVGIDL